MITQAYNFTLVCDRCGEEKHLLVNAKYGLTSKEILDIYRYENDRYSTWVLVGEELYCSDYCKEGK